MLLLTLACSRGADSAESGLPDAFLLGPEQVCDDPIQGFDRLVEVDLGLSSRAYNSGEPGVCAHHPASVLAHDLDGDGDIDLAFPQPGGLSVVEENAGGRFTAVPVGLAAEDGVYALAAGDLDGDGLPELIASGLGSVRVSWNQGDLAFSAWELVIDEPGYPRDCFASMALGDVDGDGDLDLSLAGLDRVPTAGHVYGNDESEFLAAGDRLLLNQDGSLVEAGQLEDLGAERMSLAQAWFDRDLDGDLDLFAGTDRSWTAFPPQAAYRNDGTGEDGPLLFEDGQDIGLASRDWAMGLDTADLNGDGHPDLCISDIASTLPCWLSDGSGGWYEAGAALGLTASVLEHPELPEDWGQREAYEQDLVFWGLDLVDLDNDGHLDLLASAGPVPATGNVRNGPNTFQPDVRFRGGSEGFEQAGHGDTRWSFGQALADLSGDGFPELIQAHDEGLPTVWDNPCGAGHWLEIEAPLGARVEVHLEHRVEVRELHSLRGGGQGPGRVHVGLGELDEAWVVVTLDGQTLEGLVPADRLLTVRP